MISVNTARSRRTVIFLLVLAAVLTALNALKPLHIDDPFIYRVAQQIVEAPFDPYGFDIFWLQWPQPVHEELTPPVLPYWWALGLELFGERPVLWKLWLFPFALIFVASTHTLLKRFARGSEEWGTALIALSPAFLTGFNLMQDLPATALGLAALALWMRAVDRDSSAWAIASGAVGGLAVQTKYTMVAILAAIVVDAILRGRKRLALSSVAMAVGLFALWETSMTLAYGQGMFLGQLRFGLFWWPRGSMVLPLLEMAGAVAPLTIVIGLAGLGLRSRFVLPLVACVLAGYLLLFAVPAAPVLFGILGVLFFGVLAASAVSLVVGSTPGESGGSATPWFSSVELFLVAWCVIEIAVYFSTAPFPAVRRVMGVVFVATLIAIRLVSRRTVRGFPARRLAAAGVAIGMLFQWTDVLEARGQRDAVTRAADFVARAVPDDDPTIWFLGHWGFQYYAEAAGMRPLIPDVSLLRAGDWLLEPDRVDKPSVRLAPGSFSLQATLEADRMPPLATGYGFYGGTRPLSHLADSRLRTRIYRVEHDVVPPSGWTPEQLADWAVRAGGRTAAAAAPALARELHGSDAEGRVLSARALAALGPRASAAVSALGRALDDPQPAVRYWSAVALGEVGQNAVSLRGALERLATTDDRSEVREAAAKALAAIDESAGYTEPPVRP